MTAGQKPEYLLDTKRVVVGSLCANILCKLSKKTLAAFHQRVEMILNMCDCSSNFCISQRSSLFQATRVNTN